MENHWLTWVKQLKGLADTGLHFGESEYDRERYQQVGAIAQSMLADLSNLPVDAVAKALADGEQGYRTPKIDVRAAVIRNNQILLVKEKSDGLWTLPGGYADIGLSPAENVVKEVEEEAGLRVTAQLLYCVRHKAKHAFDPDIRDFYKLYFLCLETKPADPVAGSEVSATAFFSYHQLPPLSTGRVIHKDIDLALAVHKQFLRDQTILTHFD